MRIAFTGPESCGKTTMATWFSTCYNLPLSEEYARSYLKNRTAYERKDLDQICLEQVQIWHQIGPNFVADTEMTVMKVWSEFRYNQVSEVILNAYLKQDFDHYFLCAPDIPWEEDPLRENPTDREELFEKYVRELFESKRPFTVLYGQLLERQKSCQMVMNTLLNG